jgi:hypothetical protein
MNRKKKGKPSWQSRCKQKWATNLQLVKSESVWHVLIGLNADTLVNLVCFLKMIWWDDFDSTEKFNTQNMGLLLPIWSLLSYDSLLTGYSWKLLPWSTRILQKKKKKTAVHGWTRIGRWSLPLYVGFVRKTCKYVQERKNYPGHRRMASNFLQLIALLSQSWAK